MPPVRRVHSFSVAVWLCYASRLKRDFARIVGACFLLTPAVFGQTMGIPLGFKKADLETVRLAPSSFSRVPLAIRQELSRRECTIPQVWGEKKPHNVIAGSFIQPDELDWAVLCSVNRVSTILILQNASANRVIKLAPEADIGKLQGEGGSQIGYSRLILPAERRQMNQYQALNGQEFFQIPLDHQGIEDAFVEKASVVRYFYRGRWLELAGAD